MAQACSHTSGKAYRAPYCYGTIREELPVKTALPLAVVATLALAACQQQVPTPEASASAESATAENMAGAKAGLSASNGKLVLPAVKGRPGAAYFMLSNSDTKLATLANVAIAGAAKAEAHETKDGAMAPLKNLELKPGEMIMFERGGKHVMAFDLAPTIKAGDTVEMTLTFADGNTLVVPLVAEATGGAQDHGAMH